MRLTDINLFEMSKSIRIDRETATKQTHLCYHIICITK